MAILLGNQESGETFSYAVRQIMQLKGCHLHLLSCGCHLQTCPIHPPNQNPPDPLQLCKPNQIIILQLHNPTKSQPTVTEIMPPAPPPDNSESPLPEIESPLPEISEMAAPAARQHKSEEPDLPDTPAPQPVNSRRQPLKKSSDLPSQP
ncbi:hypothetical protein PTTG_00752, partial [Puccinia triticina 1-1 BBBD Race 1]|uniref:Uncharacterized protein n=1 Tax=Puccinia triticina (isolate 1-1 / race 1 (BBBD)) TaxID=630390 RepID=A0A0C4EJ35_PUCT1